MRRRDVLALGLSTAAAQGLLGRAALALANYPERPIRLIVPFPPGGGFDTIGRPLAERIKQQSQKRTSWGSDGQTARKPA